MNRNPPATPPDTITLTFTLDELEAITERFDFRADGWSTNIEDAVYDRLCAAYGQLCETKKLKIIK